MMQYILELNPGEYGLLEARVEKLLENGLSPETPVCILGRGTKLSVLRQSTSLRSLPNALVELGMSLSDLAFLIPTRQERRIEIPKQLISTDSQGDDAVYSRTEPG